MADVGRAVQGSERDVGHSVQSSRTNVGSFEHGSGHCGQFYAELRDRHGQALQSSEIDMGCAELRDNEEQTVGPQA